MIEQSSFQAHLSLPANLDFSAALREFTMAAIKNTVETDPKWAYRLQLVVDEIFMNAVRHGSSPAATVEISLMFSPKKLEITVDDTGTGGKTINAKALTEKIDDAKKRHQALEKSGQINSNLNGRGLSQIVSAWCDSLTFEDRAPSGIRVRVVKHFP